LAGLHPIGHEVAAMSKFQACSMTAVSVIVTVLVIGWWNDLDYWRRIRTINTEITRQEVPRDQVAPTR
jgi:hypothetical protein